MMDLFQNLGAIASSGNFVEYQRLVDNSNCEDLLPDIFLRGNYDEIKFWIENRNIPLILGELIFIPPEHEDLFYLGLKREDILFEARTDRSRPDIVILVLIDEWKKEGADRTSYLVHRINTIIEDPRFPKDRLECVDKFLTDAKFWLITCNHKISTKVGF